MKGVTHTFTQLNRKIALSEIFLTVEVYPTNFRYPKSQYISVISANSHILSNYSFPLKNSNNDFFISLAERNVTNFVENKIAGGSLTVRVAATRKVNTYPYNGYLLYVRFRIEGIRSPTSYPTSVPTSYPSSRPSGQPTSTPTSLPSSLPSSRPSSLPSSTPTSFPSLIPSGVPSSQPSGQPTSQPTTQPSISYPSSFPSYNNPNSPFEFTYGNFSNKIGSNWHVRTNWNRHNVPSENSTVILKLNNNEKVYITENIEIRDLVISGNGMLIIFENVVVTINNLFELNNCDIKGVNNIYQKLILNSTFPIIKLLKNGIISSINGSSLESVILENNGKLTISPGNLYLSNSTILNTINSQITFLTTPGIKNVLKKNPNFDYYQSYEYSKLNSKNILKNILPPGTGLFDIQIPDAYLVENSGILKRDFFGFEVGSDNSAIEYYNNITNYNNYNKTLYMKIINNINLIDCSILCLQIYNCLSFDYNDYAKNCYLSEFSNENLGGLIPDLKFTHYEITKILPNPLNSYLQIFGKMSVNNTGILDIDVSTDFGTNSSLLSHTRANINFYGKISTKPYFSAELCGGKISFSAGNQENTVKNNFTNYYDTSGYNITNKYYDLNLNNYYYESINENEKNEKNNFNGFFFSLNSSMKALNCEIENYVIPPPIIIFRNGYHNIYGQIHGNFSLIVKNSGYVKFYENNLSTMIMNTVLIEDSSVLNILPINNKISLISESTVNNEYSSIYLIMNNLNLNNNGTLLFSVTKTVLTVSSVTVGSGCVVSSTGAGERERLLVSTYCIVLYSTILQCTASYCTVMYPLFHIIMRPW